MNGDNSANSPKDIDGGPHLKGYGADSALQRIHQQAYQRITDIDAELSILRHIYQSTGGPKHSTFTADTGSLLDGLGEVETQYCQNEVVPRIHELENERQGLVPLCNGLAPIHRFPASVLVTIFEYASCGYLESAPWISCAVPERALSITHVCRYWCMIAADSTIWSTIDLERPALGELTLNMGKDMLFTVVADDMSLDNVQRSTDLLSTILSQYMHYIRHLVVAESFATIGVPTLLGGCMQPAVNLESLIIPDWKDAAAIEFLQCGFPSLQSLKVSPCHLPWSSLPLTSTLVHLSIQHPVRSSRPSSEALCDSLRDLHNLRVLELAHVLSKLRKPCIPDKEREHLPLPSLQVLSLMDLTCHISDFMEILRIPCEAKVYAHCDMGNPNGDKRSTMVQRIIDTVYADPGTKLLPRSGVMSLRLSWDAINVYQYQHTTCDCDFRFPPNLTLYDSDGDFDYGGILDILSTRVDLSTLTHLVVDDMLGLPDQSAWKFLGCLPNVRSVTLQQSSPDEFLEILDETSESGSLSLYFLALQDIEFVDLCEDDYGVDVVELTSRIAEVFNGRAAAGSPILTLDIQHSPCFYEEDIIRIRESVVSLDVVWDGFELD